ncbi:MAG TPA: 3D domain-containing protein [Thermoleophilia bacterium]|nr:3D domain-containing protein [Thermoleophilia bacterium]
MRRSSLIGAAVLFAFATIALLLSAVPATRAAAAGNVEAAARAHEEAVVQLLIIERRVADAEAALVEADDRLQQSEAAVTEWTRSAESAAADLAEAKRRYAEHMVEAYKTGGAGWLELLFGSDNLSEFIGRTLLIGRILTQDAALADKVEETRAHAQETASRADSAAREQATQVSGLRATRDTLEKAKREQTALVDSLGDRLEAARAAAQAAAAKMAEVNETVRNDGGSGTTTTTTDPPGGGTDPPVGGTDPPSGQGRQLTVKSYAYALRGTTATGVPVARGVIAVDPRVIPLGTRLFVPGYGEGIAADTGGDIKGNTIDVWMSSLQAATDWGTKIITITVYD